MSTRKDLRDFLAWLRYGGFENKWIGLRVMSGDHPGRKLEEPDAYERRIVAAFIASRAAPRVLGATPPAASERRDWP